MEQYGLCGSGSCCYGLPRWQLPCCNQKQTSLLLCIYSHAVLQHLKGIKSNKLRKGAVDIGQQCQCPLSDILPRTKVHLDSLRDHFIIMPIH